MSLLEILKVIVVGIVEGFTEWLPISSTGHMILVDEIIHMNMTDEFKEVFLVVIQLGAILAVAVMYFRKLNPFDPSKKLSQRRATLELWMKIVVACLPAAVLGLLLDDWMEAHFYNGLVVSITLVLYGVLFVVLENHNAHKTFPIDKVTQIGFKTALLIGCFQLLSLIPGTSRSGSTILGAMILGCSRTASAEFSFFLGIPVMFGASLLKVVKYLIGGNLFTTDQMILMLIGMGVAFVVSVYSIKFLMSYVRQNDFKFFGYYRIVLGVIVISYTAIEALLSVSSKA